MNALYSSARPQDKAATIKTGIFWDALPRRVWGDDSIKYIVTGLTDSPITVSEPNVERDLNAYTDYSVSVVATNSMGSSTPTIHKFKTKETSK